MHAQFPLLLAALSIAITGCSATTQTTEPASSSSLGGASLAKGKALALPGPCVDPVRDARGRFGADADAAGVKSAPIDLDVDGTPDVMISHESFCGTGGCAWHLYVVRGACGHHVGELFAVLPIAEPSRHLGLVDLDVTVRNGCAGLARTEERTRFDGKEYIADRQRTCRCPDDDDDDGHSADDPDPDRFCDDWHDPKVPGKK